MTKLGRMTTIHADWTEYINNAPADKKEEEQNTQDQYYDETDDEDRKKDFTALNDHYSDLLTEVSIAIKLMPARHSECVEWRKIVEPKQSDTARQQGGGAPTLPQNGSQNGVEERQAVSPPINDGLKNPQEPTETGISGNPSNEPRPNQDNPPQDSTQTQLGVYPVQNRHHPNHYYPNTDGGGRKKYFNELNDQYSDSLERVSMSIKLMPARHSECVEWRKKVEPEQSDTARQQGGGSPKLPQNGSQNGVEERQAVSPPINDGLKNPQEPTDTGISGNSSNEPLPNQANPLQDSTHTQNGVPSMQNRPFSNHFPPFQYPHSPGPFSRYQTPPNNVQDLHQFQQPQYLQYPPHPSQVQYPSHPPQHTRLPYPHHTVMPPPGYPRRSYRMDEMLEDSHGSTTNESCERGSNEPHRRSNVPNYCNDQDLPHPVRPHAEPESGVCPLCGGTHHSAKKCKKVKTICRRCLRRNHLARTCDKKCHIYQGSHHAAIYESNSDSQEFTAHNSSQFTMSARLLAAMVTVMNDDDSRREQSSTVTEKKEIIPRFRSPEETQPMNGYGITEDWQSSMKDHHSSHSGPLPRFSSSGGMTLSCRRSEKKKREADDVCDTCLHRHRNDCRSLGLVLNCHSSPLPPRIYNSSLPT